MISAEYGWTDEQILDTPVTRVRQIVEAIRIRRDRLDYRDRARLQWQTRWIASFVAAASPAGPQLAPKVELIDLFHEDQPEERPQPSPPSTEPAVGTFEKFMGAFRGKTGASMLRPPDE